MKKQKSQLSNKIKKRWQLLSRPNGSLNRHLLLQCGAAAVVLMLGGAASAARVSPYFYTWGLGNSVYPVTSLADAKSKKFDDLTLAFVVSGGGCNYNADWTEALFADAQKFTSGTDAGRLTLSFGGANGQYIEESCTDANTMAQKMSELVTKTGASGVDFDVEGARANAGAHAIRSAALKAFQKTNANVDVSFTLAACPDGLNELGKATLKSAVDAGVKIKYVNLMLMDYGPAYSGGKSMGKVGEASLLKVKDQIKEYFPSDSDQQLWARLGATPMIGQNDVASEKFDLDDAQYMVDQVFKKYNIGLISYWALQRDQPGSALATSSGLPNIKNFDFYNIFKGSKSYTPANLSSEIRISEVYQDVDHTETTKNCRQWKEGDTFKIGDIVEYQGKTYTNRQAHTAWLGTGWNPVITPALWLEGGFCAGKDTPPVTNTCKAWDPNTSYIAGQVVEYQSGFYVALTAMGQVDSHLTPSTTLTTWQKVPQCTQVSDTVTPPVNTAKKEVKDIHFTWRGAATGCPQPKDKKCDLLFSKDKKYPVQHNFATEGSGTPDDPITLGTQGKPFSPGALVYIAAFKKYFIFEDSCPGCVGDTYMEGFMGPSTEGGDKDALFTCARKWSTEPTNPTNPKISIIINPEKTLEVDKTPMLTADGKCKGGNSSGGLVPSPITIPDTSNLPANSGNGKVDPVTSKIDPTQGVTIKLENNCSIPLTPMMVPNFKDEAEKASLNTKVKGIDPNNMPEIKPNDSLIFTIANGWPGRIWIGKDRWNGGTATLAELAINLGDNMHWYDVSYIDGYNVPVRITPQKGGSIPASCSAPSKCKMTKCITSGESNEEGVFSQRCEGPCGIGKGAREVGSLARCGNPLDDQWERACSKYTGEYAQEPNPSPAKELVEAYSFTIQDKATKACRADLMDSFVVSFCYK